MADLYIMHIQVKFTIPYIRCAICSKAQEQRASNTLLRCSAIIVQGSFCIEDFEQNHVIISKNDGSYNYLRAINLCFLSNKTERILKGKNVLINVKKHSKPSGRFTVCCDFYGEAERKNRIFSIRRNVSGNLSGLFRLWKRGSLPRGRI